MAAKPVEQNVKLGPDYLAALSTYAVQRYLQSLHQAKLAACSYGPKPRPVAIDMQLVQLGVAQCWDTLSLGLSTGTVAVAWETPGLFSKTFVKWTVYVIDIGIMR